MRFTTTHEQEPDWPTRERIPCDEIYMTIKQARAGQRRKCRELGLTEKEGMTTNRKPRSRDLKKNK